MEIVENALSAGRRTLTEYEAKQLLSGYGVPTTRERLAGSAEEAAQAAEAIGFPVAVKGYGAGLLHKTEAGAVHLGVTDAHSVAAAYERMAKRLGDGLEGVVISEMISGSRELVMGLHREPGFGPCVMIGVGGVLTELINDTAFRVAPFDVSEAADMAMDLRANAIFGAFRGEPAADMDALCKSLAAIGEIGMNHPEISEIDVNPVIITPKGGIVAVDALVVLKGGK